MEFKITRIDQRNKNGYLIPREAMEDYLENRYDGKDILCISDPFQDQLSLTDVTHVVKDLKLDGDFLVADIDILDDSIKGMINDGVSFAASYQAKTSKNGEVSDINHMRCFPTLNLAFDE